MSDFDLEDFLSEDDLKKKVKDLKAKRTEKVEKNLDDEDDEPEEFVISQVKTNRRNILRKKK